MSVYTHGGDIYGAQSQYRGEILDFSANINPLGMPETLRQAAEEAVASADRYPDSLCRTLRAGIAQRDGTTMEQVLCGGGAADLIFRLVYAQKPRRALVTAPAFSEYEEALTAYGGSVTRHMLLRQETFVLTERVLDDLDDTVDLAFFCNPNNPTGRPIAPALMEQILERCQEKRIRLVVDECFLELSDSGESGGLAGVLKAYPNLVLLRAFTKSYAIPGLRLGYCLCADETLLDEMVRCGPPWAVSAPAQAAGLAALACPEHPAQARAFLAVERPFLVEQLTTLGLEVIPGVANYLLFRAPGVPDLKQRLLAHGVLIRSCANYYGLGEEDYRVAVRPRSENERLIQTLKEVLPWQGQL